MCLSVDLSVDTDRVAGYPGWLPDKCWIDKPPQRNCEMGRRRQTSVGVSAGWHGCHRSGCHWPSILKYVTARKWNNFPWRNNISVKSAATMTSYDS